MRNTIGQKVFTVRKTVAQSLYGEEVVIPALAEGMVLAEINGGIDGTKVRFSSGVGPSGRISVITEDAVLAMVQ